MVLVRLGRATKIAPCWVSERTTGCGLRAAVVFPVPGMTWFSIPLERAGVMLCSFGLVENR